MAVRDPRRSRAGTARGHAALHRAFDGVKLETFYFGWYIQNAKRFDSVPKLTAKKRDPLASYEAIANDPALCFDMHVRPGDVQWLRNAFVLHKRAAFEEFPGAEATPSPRMAVGTRHR